MSGAVRVLIVVPTYNEERRLDIVAFMEFLEGDDEIGFLFVDDGSTDGTARLLEGLAERAGGRVACLRLERNRGKAEAVRRGILAALGRGAELVGYWDADLATPLEVVPAFVEVLDREPSLELVMGARVQLLGRRIERHPSRHYLGRLFATAASALLGVPVYDTQCGAKLFRATPEAGRLFAEPFLSRWIFDVELLARMVAWTGTDVRRAVYEYPLLAWNDVAGSRVRGRDFLRAPRELAAIWWRYLRGRPRVVAREASVVAAPPVHR